MTVFWRNLKEDRVIDIARPQKEKCKTFEDLKKIVRIAEREVRDRASINSQGKHTPARQSHQSVAAERTAVDEADSYGNMEKLLKAMTKPMRSLQDRIDELEKKQTASVAARQLQSDADRRIAEMERELHELRNRSDAGNEIEHLRKENQRLKEKLNEKRQPQKKQGSPSKPNKCYACGEEGHMSKDCTSPNKKTVKCYNCNGEGHIAKRCPEPKAEKKTESVQVQTIKPTGRRHPYRRKARPTPIMATRCVKSDRLVGEPNEMYASVNGISCRCLIDTGSQVTMVSSSFYDQNLKSLPIDPVEELLEIRGAGGQAVPFLGCIEVGISFPKEVFGDGQEFTVLALVVPDTEYSKEVPVTVGTNLLGLYKYQTTGGKRKHGVVQCHRISTIGRQALQRLEARDRFIGKKGNLGVVRALLSSPLRVPPNQAETLWGKAKSGPPGDKYVVTIEPSGRWDEHSGWISGPILAEMTCGRKKSKVPIVVQNRTSKTLVLKPGDPLGVARAVIGIESEPPVVMARQHTCDTQGENIIKSGGLEFDMSESVLNGEQMCAVQLFDEKSPVFSKHEDDLGHCTVVKHRIPVTDNQPVRERHRRIPPAMYDEVKRVLKGMLDSGAIRKSHSPWAAPVVLVQKKDGTTRLCVDYRRLNARTIRDAYPIPRIEETLDLLKGAKWFSSIDLKSGYWQIAMSEEDIPKTAFTTPLGFFECCRMPFGLKNAGATFQRTMEQCMDGLNMKICLVYLDDIIVFSSTFEEHLDRLKVVMDRLEGYNLKIKHTKCQFFRDRVRYLGHVVSEDGVETDPEKVKALETWPVPKNVHELKSFLGFTSYYRRFVEGFANIARPLTKLTAGLPARRKRGKKPTDSKQTQPTFVWTEECQQAFDMLIRKLTNPPVLAYTDYSKPFELHTDASTSGLGAALYQEHIVGGKVVKRPVAYASRSLSQSEKNYPAHKLEFLALKWAMTEKFHEYLYGNHVEVLTDNNPLTYITTSAKLDATGYRWLAALSNYDFNLTYRPGRNNGDADALSRKPQTCRPAELVRLSSDQFKTVCQGQLVTHSPLVEAVALTATAVPAAIDEPIPWPGDSTLPALRMTDWRRLQQEDPVIGRLYAWKAKSELPTVSERKKEQPDVQIGLREWNRLCFRNEVLHRSRVGADGQKHYQLVLPKAYRDMALEGYTTRLDIWVKSAP
ncbi:uncharacterized protein [Ptychodera flava]|uniref:uncharacterized protein n=1 Tax=Ptychodera flava TaxID=63121 RepID=UPI00396A90C2